MSLSDISNTVDSNERRSQSVDNRDPLLVPNDKRFVVFPIEYKDVWQSYKRLFKRFWTADKVQLDETSMEGVKGAARLVLERLLVAWSVQAGQSALVLDLSDRVQAPEARAFFGFHNYQAVNHRETFAKILRPLARDSRGETIAHSLAVVKQALKVRDERIWALFSAESFAGKLAVYSAVQAIGGASLKLLQQPQAILTSTAIIDDSQDSKMTDDRTKDISEEHLSVSDIIERVLADRLEFTQFGSLLMSHCITRPKSEKVQSIVREVAEAEVEMLERSALVVLDHEKFGTELGNLRSLLHRLVQAQMDSACRELKCDLISLAR